MLKIEIGIEMFIYLLIAGFLSYMAYAFLYKLNFSRECNLSLCYFIAYLVIITRIVYFGMSFNYYKAHEVPEGEQSWQNIFVMQSSDIACTYFMILLGIVQLDKFTSIAADISSLLQ